MYQAAASCKDIARASVTNWEPHGVTLAGYCYAVRHGLKVQLVTPYGVSHLQRQGNKLRGEVTSVYQPLKITRTPLQCKGVLVIFKACICYVFKYIFFVIKFC